jgi:hypothetical protein
MSDTMPPSDEDAMQECPFGARRAPSHAFDMSSLGAGDYNTGVQQAA